MYLSQCGARLDYVVTWSHTTGSLTGPSSGGGGHLVDMAIDRGPCPRLGEALADGSSMPSGGTGRSTATWSTSIPKSTIQPSDKKGTSLANSA